MLLVFEALKVRTCEPRVNMLFSGEPHSIVHSRLSRQYWTELIPGGMLGLS